MSMGRTDSILKPPWNEHVKVARERLGVARHVDRPLRGQSNERLQHGRMASRTWRIEDDRVGPGLHRVEHVLRFPFDELHVLYA